MDFKFYCIHCGQHIAAREEDRGTEGTCPTCGDTFTVPAVAPKPTGPATIRSSTSSVILPQAAMPVPRSGYTLPAPHTSRPSGTRAVEMLVANEAARAKRAGYWIIASVLAVIGIGVLFIVMPHTPLMPVAATGTPKSSKDSASLKEASSASVAAALPAPAAPAGAATSAPDAPAAPGAPAAPAAPAAGDKPATAEMKPEDSEPKAKLEVVNGVPIPTDQIINGSRRTVDELLVSDFYTIRPSTKKQVPGTETVYYDGDVNIIVQYRADRAIGVTVVAPTNPPKPIGPDQYRTLMRLVGQAAKDSDIKKDATGILEFSVGEK